MMNDREVRAWAVEQGIDVSPRGKLPAYVRDRYQAEHPEEPYPAGAGVDPVNADALAEALAGLEPGVPGETAPRAPAPATAVATVKQKLRDRAGIGTGSRKRRLSLEDLGSTVWQGIAYIAGRGGQVPVQRVLKLQAPVAGVVIEDALRNTVADRVLQPLARMNASCKDLSSLLGPPILVGLISNDPELAPMCMPMLVQCLEDWVIIAGPQMRKQRERAEKAAGELGTDGMHEMLATIFAGVEGVKIGAPAAA